ncbi:MAG: polysaccharide deacetylase family protein, partial [Patescibacteria group bacterium]
SVFRSVSALSRMPYHSNEPAVKGATAPQSPDCAVLPCMALTFDDGPHEMITPRVLDILAQQDVKATFFIVGSRVAGREQLVKRAYRDGHEVGNHSWSHPDLRTLSPADVELQLRLSQAAIAGAGVPAPRVFRPPYGAVDHMVQGHVNMTIVRWNIDPEDWKVKDAAEIQRKMLLYARPGGIILMHDTDPATADALGPALQALKTQYQFVTVSQLLRLSPGDQGQYFGR